MAFCILSACNTPYQNNKNDITQTNLKPPIVLAAGNPIIRNAGAPMIVNGDNYTAILADSVRNIENQHQKPKDDSYTICCEYFDKDGNLWIGPHHGNGICRFDGKKITYYRKFQNMPDTIIYSMMQDDSGKLWIGTAEGLTSFDGKNFATYTSSQGLPGNDVYGMVKDGKGNLWFGTDNGVCCFDGKSFINYTNNQGLCNNYITSVAIDTLGNLWFGSGTGLGTKLTDYAAGGVSCYNGKNFTNYTTAQGLISNSIYNMSVTRHNIIWFCGFGGICSYNGTNFTCYENKKGQLETDFLFGVLADSKDRIWIKTAWGTWVYDGKIFQKFDRPYYKNIGTFTEDRKGNIWFGTGSGQIIKYDGKTDTTYKIY